MGFISISASQLLPLPPKNPRKLRFQSETANFNGAQMALAVSSFSPSLRIPQRNLRLGVSASNFRSSFLRFSRTTPSYKSLICTAAATSPAESSYPDDDMDPYEVLDVSSFTGFDKIRLAYAKKRKEAEKIGDDTTVARLEKAYDKIMMKQLTNRTKGVASGSFKVPKDIKYADRQPIVPWGPRFSKSSVRDIQLNLAISAAFTIWVVASRNAEYKPMQFLVFAYVYRFFEKLKAFEPSISPTISEDGVDNGRTIRMGKRLVRSLALAFGCVAISSLGFTLYLNVAENLRGAISLTLVNNQERLITISTAIMLYILGSYYR